MIIFAQILGIIAMIIASISLQSKTQKNIALLQVCSTFLFTIHFALIGAYTGAILNFLGMIRAAIYSKRDKKWAAHPIWIIVFIVLSIVVYMLSFVLFKIPPTLRNCFIESLVVIGMLFTTLGLRQKEAKMVRIYTLINSPLWLIYNVCNFSIGGILAECFTIISIIIAMFRLDIRRK
ncbi:MAG: YgjV family protein [Clostridiales bacterium]|nr:YgjV family protein [Clostridiales bacterium]